MRNPFRSKFRITQEYSKNPSYYKRFGLKGHEGLDLVPTGKVLDVMALEEGIVVRDEDNPKSGAYGNFLTLWHPTIKKATQYAHLKENILKVGDRVQKGQKIGTMGNSGNTTGPHLHLNLFEVDDKGIRLNRNNGYYGGIDPLPWLEEGESSPDALTECLAQHTKLVDEAFEKDKQIGELTETNKRIREEKQQCEITKTKQLQDLSEKLDTVPEYPEIMGKIEALLGIEDERHELAALVDSINKTNTKIKGDNEKLIEEEKRLNAKILEQGTEIEGLRKKLATKPTTTPSGKVYVAKQPYYWWVKLGTVILLVISILINVFK